MTELLVHLHIYYHDQVDYFIEKLGNINGTEWDLVVTYSEWNEETAKKFRDFKPDVKFMEVKNFGYDVWPFIKLIKSINLDDYKYVIKLHTKRKIGSCRPNIIKLKGYDWRNALVDGILYNKAYFRKILERFRTDLQTGMVYNLLVSVSRDYYDDFVLKELNRLGMHEKGKYTCMGSMFMVRSEAMRPLQSELITEEMFQDHRPVSGSPLRNAHLYERILSHLTINRGFRNETYCPSKKDYYHIKIMKAIEPLGKFIFCCEREGAGHRKFINILGIRVYTGKDILSFD